MSGRGGREHGVKFGGGGMASESNANYERKERLRKLAQETIDLQKDPYFMRNHLGSYECKLCLTLHTNEASYLSHTQGKRHQEGLKKRAMMEARERGTEIAPKPKMTQRKKLATIGTPGYRITKQVDKESGQKALLFEIDFPEIRHGFQPRHRFMSSFEQRVDRPDPKYQYLLFAGPPYTTIAFRIPNLEVERFLKSKWDAEAKVFHLRVNFKVQQQGESKPQLAQSSQLSSQQDMEHSSTSALSGSNFSNPLAPSSSSSTMMQPRSQR